MSRLAAKVNKTLSVFEKARDNLAKLIGEGYQEAANIADKQAELEAERLDVLEAVDKAVNSKNKIEEIVGA